MKKTTFYVLAGAVIIAIFSFLIYKNIDDSFNRIDCSSGLEEPSYDPVQVAEDVGSIPSAYSVAWVYYPRVDSNRISISSEVYVRESRRHAIDSDSWNEKIGVIRESLSAVKRSEIDVLFMVKKDSDSDPEGYKISSYGSHKVDGFLRFFECSYERTGQTEKEKGCYSLGSDPSPVVGAEVSFSNPPGEAEAAC